ncbi:MAG: hypothetical protein HY658_07665 [Actinobacteria bacterium]|nr:hypothetical protein [Actinomycetota bacterium]
MRAPLERPAAERFKPWLVGLLVLNALVGGALTLAGQSLSTTAAPQGILSLEFAGSVAGVERILATWGPRELAVAGFALGFDYLYMPLYALGIALLWSKVVVVARARGRTRVAAWGVTLAWAPVAAALLDAVENAAALRLLTSSPADPWPSLVLWAATSKFALLALSLALLVWAAVALRRRPA